MRFPSLRTFHLTADCESISAVSIAPLAAFITAHREQLASLELPLPREAPALCAALSAPLPRLQHLTLETTETHPGLTHLLTARLLGASGFPLALALRVPNITVPLISASHSMLTSVRADLTSPEAFVMEMLQTCTRLTRLENIYPYPLPLTRGALADRLESAQYVSLTPATPYPSLRFAAVTLEPRDKFAEVAPLLLSLLKRCPALRHLQVLNLHVESPADLQSLQCSIYALGTLDTLELNCTVPVRSGAKFCQDMPLFPWMQVRVSIFEDFEELGRRLLLRYRRNMNRR